MATTSPANKFRTKTSDFADFLRGVGQHQHHTNTPRRAPDNLPTPSTSTSDAQDGVRRKKTLIPFFGRVRRKSNVSGISGGEVSEQESDKRSQSLALAADDQWPVASAASQNQLPNTASRVTKLRTLRRPNGRIIGVRSPTGYTSDSLVPPPKKDRPSIDSTTSKETRSTTPRPKQPTITISQPPNSFLDDNYDDLFTKPRKKLHTGASPYSLTSSDHDDRVFHSDGDIFPTSFQLFPLSSSSNISLQPASSTPPMSPTSLREWRIVGDETSSIKSTRSSRRVVSDDIPRTSGEESEAISTISMPVTSASGTDKRSSMTSWLHNESRRSKSMIRSSRQSVPNQPPTIPLPATPGPQMVPAQLSSLSYSGIRPRAVTLSSSASARANIATSPLPTSLPPRHSKSISRDRKSTDENAKKENTAFDIETATVDQLRQALILRDQQLDELASYLLKVTQNHVTEKNALEKKIASLEREAARREKEIKGLTWLVSSNRMPGNVPLSSTGFKATPALESDKSKGDTTSPVIKSPSYKRINSDYDDSGAESYPTSRTESARGSLSGGESSSSPFQQVKSHKLAPKLGLLRGSSLRMGSTRPALESERKDVPKVDKRASVSSFASSAASSSLSGSSSMMLPSSPSTTTLSAIPEGPPPTPPKKPMSRDPAIVAAIGTTEQRREKDQKKVARSMNTAPTPAAAYAANLQKARPPSIGQILNQTEIS
ncbi:hypothetical protein DFS33DRAFT_761504 [Desarmillaria ectypa]|nr:hypothetical protein DFS33DRAFT_761504 [Desarmillaria ectypa]